MTLVRVRIERKLQTVGVSAAEMYVDGIRENVSQITPDRPVGELDIPVHRDGGRFWVEFEADVEIKEIEEWFGVCRIAEVRNIHDCI